MRLFLFLLIYYPMLSSYLYCHPIFSCRFVIQYQCLSIYYLMIEHKMNRNQVYLYCCWIPIMMNLNQLDLCEEIRMNTIESLFIFLLCHQGMNRATIFLTKLECQSNTMYVSVTLYIINHASTLPFGDKVGLDFRVGSSGTRFPGGLFNGMYR
ncbi:hypothetical protein BDB01DRAFT_611276 [Pilobolus umbonatus]|nr:hypothetical protein BDB01DRAFT_611276 [Pilobolus umbonatus]